MSDRNYDFCDDPLNELVDADRRVRELEDELAESQSKILRWIPVSERLPKNGERTLVRCLGQTYVGTFREVPFPAGCGLHCYWDSDECDTYLSVTHWMTLPEPPDVK
jgi:hypothetical protein